MTEEWTAYILRGQFGVLLRALPVLRELVRRHAGRLIFYNTYFEDEDPHISVRITGDTSLLDERLREFLGVTVEKQPYGEEAWIREAYRCGTHLAVELEEFTGVPLERIDDDTLAHMLHGFYDNVRGEQYRENEVAFWLRLAYVVTRKDRRRPLPRKGV